MELITKKYEFGTGKKEITIGDIIYLCKDTPLKLQCGAEISNVPISFQMFGELNEDNPLKRVSSSMIAPDNSQVVTF
mgnify:CR=1 FL=1